jgi:alpha-beta hydrolase superfamily lysophospholipase
MYEHAGRYDHVASEFVKHGFSVYAPDHRGHGRTEGGRGEIDTFDDFVNDGINLIEAVDASQKNIPGRKLFLFGHSMGGAIAARIAQVRPKLWAGVILSGPGLGVGVDVGHGCLLAILNVLRKCVPHAPFPPFDPSLVVGYAPSSKAYAEDELNYRGGPKLSLVYHMGRANQAVWRNAGAWTLPLLVVHGADDVVCPVKFSRRFVETVNSKSKTLKVYPGLKHEILNEAPASRELVLQDMCEWLRITSGEL